MSNSTDARKIVEVAQALGTKPEWLDALINFETGGSYDPLQPNMGGSSGKGLIQVMDSTAKTEFGVEDSSVLVLLYPTFDSQMDNVVLPYLKKYAPYTTQQALYMAVFYPKFMNVPPATPFPDYVQEANRNSRGEKVIVYVSDYIDLVNRRVKKGGLRLPFGLPSTVPILLIVGGVVLYLRLKNR